MRTRNLVLDWGWGLSGHRKGGEQHEQVAHERLREGDSVTYYTAQNEAAQTLSPGRADDLGAWTRSRRDAFARLRHHSAQLLAGLEDRHRSRGNFHRVAGARIARHASLALADLERAKSPHLNVMLFGQVRVDPA